MMQAIMRAFRPLDTSEADEAIAAAQRAHKDVQVRARALRMDVSCGDATAILKRKGELIVQAGQTMLGRLYSVDEVVPADMMLLLGKLD
jgi:hypothetical protein